MKPHRVIVRLLGMMLGTFPLAASADDAPKPAPAAIPAEAAKNAPPAKPAPPPVKPPAEAALRSTINKSLGFLAKEGEQWMSDRSCNGCHHLPTLLWSHREAKQRGFPVDHDKFAEWLFWANESAAGKSSGSYEVFAYLIMAVPDHPAPVLTQRIAAEQKADATPKPPVKPVDMTGAAIPVASDPASLRTLLLALASPPTPLPENDPARDKAAAELKKMAPAKTIDSLVYRTLYARRFGKPEDAKSLCDQILKLQRGDGGWSQGIGTNQSDPLATGQALYVLQPATDPKTADAVARAQNWLVGLQREEGSWPIDYAFLSTTDRSAPDKASSRKNVTMIYTFWGSAWATIGLLQAFPVKEDTPHETAAVLGN